MTNTMLDSLKEKRQKEVELAENNLKASKARVMAINKILTNREKTWKKSDTQLRIENSNKSNGNRLDMYATENPIEIYAKMRLLVLDLYDKLDVGRFNGLEEGNFASHVVETYLDPLRDRLNERTMGREEYHRIRRTDRDKLVDNIINQGVETYKGTENISRFSRKSNETVDQVA